LGKLNINRPFNGDDGRLQGVEVSLGTFFDFDFLPEWARGFGLRGNYTYIDAGAELPADQAESLPGQQPVVGVSEHAYNIVALYEKPQFSARLAYNYQSSFVDGYNRVRDFTLPAAGLPNSAPFLPIIEDGRGVLDFSASVNPRENVTIAFNVSNILGTPVRRHRAYNVAGDIFPRQVKYLERIFSLGVRVRLQ
jgi:outer membrane receptor protein involved in Fe transport